MTTFNRIGKSIVAVVTILAAIVVGFNPGIAKADEDPPKTNVHLNVDSHFVQGLKPANILTDWYATVYPLGTNTMTLSAASMYEREPDLQGQTLNWAGDHFGGAGIETGKMMLKGHFGENGDFVAGPVDIGVGNPYTLNANFVAMSSYKPFPVGTMPTTNTGTKPGTAAAKPAVKAAAPLGTPLCVVTASKPTVTTGFAAIVSGGHTWTGKVVFVPVNVKLLRVEEGRARAKQMAADPKSDKVLNFGSVPDGTNMRLGSGDYQVYRLTAGDPVYLGYLQASPGGTYNTVTAVNGACKVYDLKALRTPGTGAALNLLALFAVIFGLGGFGWLNRDKLVAIRLPSIG